MGERKDTETRLSSRLETAAALLRTKLAPVSPSVKLLAELLQAQPEFSNTIKKRLRKGQLICAARTKRHNGRPCLAQPVKGKQRCKYHGGLSTGPKTPEGRERCRQAALRMWAKWRAARQG
jgi:hypothetical protein